MFIRENFLKRREKLNVLRTGISEKKYPSHSEQKNAWILCLTMGQDKFPLFRVLICLVGQRVPLWETIFFKLVFFVASCFDFLFNANAFFRLVNLFFCLSVKCFVSVSLRVNFFNGGYFVCPKEKTLTF